MGTSAARRLELAGPEVANERRAEGLRWFHVTVLSNFARGYDRYAVRVAAYTEPSLFWERLSTVAK